MRREQERIRGSTVSSTEVGATATAGVEKRSRECLEETQDEREAILRRHDVRTLREEHERGVVQRAVLRRPVVRSTRCRLCGIDVESERSVAEWVTRYEKMCVRLSASPKSYSLEEWQNLLEERLGEVAQTWFQDEVTHEPFFVHRGCVDITWDWHMGREMPQIALEASDTKCDLCREFGATCVCTQPNCDRTYHTSCAYFSPGNYPWGTVSFGAMPHLRKCARCPTHREHEPSSAKSGKTKGSAGEVVLDTRSAEEYQKDIRPIE